jgi:hypothetical protein
MPSNARARALAHMSHNHPPAISVLANRRWRWPANFAAWLPQRQVRISLEDEQGRLDSGHAALEAERARTFAIRTH